MSRKINLVVAIRGVIIGILMGWFVWNITPLPWHGYMMMPAIIIALFYTIATRTNV